MSIRTHLFSLAVVSAFISLFPAQATQLVNIDASDNNWRSTSSDSIGHAWLAGTFNPLQGMAPRRNYTNPQTKTLSGEDMMWFCVNQSCTIPLSDPPLHDDIAYFATNLDLTSADNFGWFDVIADDYMELWINGKLVFNAMLADNMHWNGQPKTVTLIVDGMDLAITGGKTIYRAADVLDVFHLGDNTIAIKAMDGWLSHDMSCEPIIDSKGHYGSQTFCARDNVNRYLFVSAPEPASLGILAAGLLLLPRRRKQH